jgi:hypothetical protein
MSALYRLLSAAQGEKVRVLKAAKASKVRVTTL